jgi:ribosome biogenesis GTPase
MPDVATAARGRRARAARRRAEKAEIRRLERASMLEDTDETPTGGADQPTTAGSDRAPSGDREANHVTGAIDHNGASRAVDIQAGGSVVTGLVAGIRRGGEITVLVGSEACAARLSRGLLQQQIAVAVGDRVQMSIGQDGRRTVVGVEPRRSRLARIREDRTRRSGFSRQDVVLAANVDISVIVAAVAQPAFHPKLVDRFLVICQYGGIRPILCLNKCDLVPAPPDVSVYEQIGLPIVYTSAEAGTGLDELRSLLHGSVAVFTGHSGVGKSSLVNALLGDARQVVGAVRNADGRGRHTTTWSTLLHWDDDSFVVDTPGVRSLGIWRIDPVTLGGYFREFDVLGARCRFSGCSHTHEPDCAVKAAAESGELPIQRYQSYLRLMDG